MNMKVCPKGHFYDGDTNVNCPVCEAEKRQGGAAEYGATEPVGGGYSAGGIDSVGETEPIGRNSNNYYYNEEETRPLGEQRGGFTDTKPPTRPFRDTGETMRYVDSSVPGADNYNDQTLPHSPGMVAGFTPVVGWLVCIEGPDRGHDYRIRTGYNHIGRAEHMDICIRGDKQISREKHALVAYDDTEKVFFFGPSDGKNIVRVNDKLVMVPTQLHAYDTVTVGTSKLIFVPLCGENFNWNE